MAGKVVLLVTAGPLKGSQWDFTEHDTFVFGRAPDCQARLPMDDPQSSRRHFLIEVNPPEVLLRDLGSLNGTFVNGKRYGSRAAGGPAREGAAAEEAVPLGNGDRIRAGTSEFTVRVEVLAVCCRCGAQIPPAREHVSRWRQDLLLCQGCREEADRDGQGKPETVVCCAKCGRDASREVQPGVGGQLLCSACRETADVTGIVRSIFGRSPDLGGRDAAVLIQGFEVREKIGEGANGAVYRAVRRDRDEEVAVKMLISRLPVDEMTRAEMRGRFRMEINALRQLDHPCIVRFLCHGDSRVVFYFVMEYCRGGSLESLRVRRGGTVPVPEACGLILQALEGLAAAHDRGLVHRDIKPENILLTEEDAGRAKLSDFGLVRCFARRGLAGFTTGRRFSTMQGAFGGSLPFMPPEQIGSFRHLLPVSDIWSTAATLYYIVSGSPPRDLPPHPVALQDTLEAKVVPLWERDPSLPEDLWQVLDRALAYSTEARYQDAREFAEALRPFAAGDLAP